MAIALGVKDKFKKDLRELILEYGEHLREAGVDVDGLKTGLRTGNLGFVPDIVVSMNRKNKERAQPVTEKSAEGMEKLLELVNRSDNLDLLRNEFDLQHSD